MNPDIKAQWVSALRSGGYEQGRGVLKTSEGKFCCLGVLCELAVQAKVISPPRRSATSTGPAWHYGDKDIYDESEIILPKAVAEWAGLLEQNPEVVALSGEALQVAEECFSHNGFKGLAELNDTGFNFAAIADLIGKYL